MELFRKFPIALKYHSKAHGRKWLVQLIQLIQLKEQQQKKGGGEIADQKLDQCDHFYHINPISYLPDYSLFKKQTWDNITNW